MIEWVFICAKVVIASEAVAGWETWGLRCDLPKYICSISLNGFDLHVHYVLLSRNLYVHHVRLRPTLNECSRGYYVCDLIYEWKKLHEQGTNEHSVRTRYQGTLKFIENGLLHDVYDLHHLIWIFIIVNICWQKKWYRMVFNGIACYSMVLHAIVC